MSVVSEFYDQYTTQQKEIGVNKRHHTILGWLKKFGLQSHWSVLEIGCGIGTFTSLLAPELKDGKLTVNDISPKSIELAKGNLRAHNNINYLVGDILPLSIHEKFDLIVLPDVLEHIPMEQHNRLFEKLASLLKADGYIFIHIPNPLYMEWAHKNTPELLQIIDQSLHTDHICQVTYPHGLYIHFLTTYTIWLENGDHQAIVLRKRIEKNYPEVIPPIPPLHKRIVNRLKGLFN
jgi:2-polyprenyl-3-methyl-5-hydroxy-6-metoxy-1,4-benzoquinol methylase